MRPRRRVLCTFTQSILSWGDAGGIVDEAFTVRKGQHLAAELDDLLGGVGGDIARAGDDRGLALDIPPGAGISSVLAAGIQ